MKLLIDKSFEQDTKKIRDKSLLNRIALVARELQDVKSLSEISHVKKLSGSRDYFRIRVGDFRIGLRMKSNEIVFERFLHRKEIYRYYPPK